MKDFLKKLFELWRKPKYHALMALGLWFLFFFLCFLSLFIMNSLKKPVVYNKTYSIDNMDNYECNYQITINDKVYNLTGNRYKNKELVELLNPMKTYIIVDNQKIDLLKGIDFVALRPDNIALLLDDALDKKTITYENNQTKDTYQIKGSNLKIIDTSIKDESVYLSILKNKSTVKEIVLDITQIMHKKDKKINNYKIVMTYSKYGQISDFAID